jgi:tRNA G18 (ribose-2'-O)-methylase SpoU
MPLVQVESAADPRVAEYREISDGARKRAQGLFVAEGRFVVARLVAARRFGVRSLFLTETALASLEPVVASIRDRVPLYVASKATMRDVTGFQFHQGCLALGERPAGEPSIDDLLQGARRVVLLEGVTHADNVGAVFRSAAAFACDAVVLDPASADPLYREAIRVSMAATLQVPFARARAWPADLARLRDAGFTIVALTPRAEAIPIGHAPWPERVALLLGSEGEGLSERALSGADMAMRIPIAPTVDSLNVAATAAIALYVLAAAPRI